MKTAAAILVELRKPLLIDEWQLVPEVLGAVKRAVDDDDVPKDGFEDLPLSKQCALARGVQPASAASPSNRSAAGSPSMRIEPGPYWIARPARYATVRCVPCAGGS